MFSAAAASSQGLDPHAGPLAHTLTQTPDCERVLLRHARLARSIAQHLNTGPPALVRREAITLVGTVADVLLLNTDIALHLMPDKIEQEDLYHHPLNVTLLAMVLARAMRLPVDTLCAVGLGALFHDVGRQAPRSVQAPSQAAIDFQHGSRGRALCAALELPETAMQVITQHHERIDGSGHPKGLRAAQISQAAQVVGLADCFDELCNPDEPELALTPHEALSVMHGQQRQRFDPTTMTSFVRCMGLYPPGTVVRLSNGGVGTVVAVNSRRPLTPTLQVYDPAAPSQGARFIDLAKTPALTIVGALRPQQLTPAAQHSLAPHKRMTYQFSALPRPA